MLDRDEEDLMCLWDVDWCFVKFNFIDFLCLLFRVYIEFCIGGEKSLLVYIEY